MRLSKEVKAARVNYRVGQAPAVVMPRASVMREWVEAGSRLNLVGLALTVGRFTIAEQGVEARDV